MNQTHTTPAELPGRVDVLVVGAGPAGLSTALVLGRQQRRVLCVDSGRPRNESAGEMHMYLTRDGEDPATVRALGRAELARHPQVVLQRGEVVTVSGGPGALRAELADGRHVTASRLVLAGGVRDQLEDLPGLAGRWGSDVVHCPYCHGFETLGRSVVVLLNEPADAMMARYVADRFASSTVLCTRGREVPDELLQGARAAGVEVDTRPVVALDGAPGAVVVRLADGAERRCQVVFHRPAVEQASPLPAALGCRTDDHGLLLVSPTMATSVPGVFAAGDCAVTEGAPAPLAFVSSAVADGQRAAVWVEQELFRDSMTSA